MRKYILSAALCMSALNVHAALTNGDNLSITSGTFSSGETPFVGQGSWFGMEVALDNHVFTAIKGLNGINLGSAQPLPPDIDMPWTFFSTAGLHLTTSPADVLSTGRGTAWIDFSGWGISWSGFPVIDMGSGAWGANVDGAAYVTCSIDCSNGDSYILNYTATVPVGDPSGFGGVRYLLHLEGYVTAIPIPAAAWLFGSGFIGLIGVAKREKL